MPLDADDARAIADMLLEAATDIDRYLDDNWTKITRAEYETISESAKTILRLAGVVTTVAVGLSIQEMANASAELRQVITSAKDKLGSLREVGRAIQIAAKLADLASGIMARNPGAVFRAARDLQELSEQ